MADNETNVLQVEVSEEEVSLLTMSLALLITMFDDDIEKWQNKKDTSMDKLFFMMDKKYGAMNLWRKVLVSAGADPEALAQHIEQATDEER
jgi:hypothetical protein